jgi:hypothetical protein
VATTTSIVEEADSYGDYTATKVTSYYGTVGGDERTQQRLLNCLQDVVDSSFAVINKDTDKGFMRAMASAKQKMSLEVQHPSTGTIGPAWSQGVQPPAQCLRLCARGRFSRYELPQHYTNKPRSLPLYGLHELIYGLPNVKTVC